MEERTAPVAYGTIAVVCEKCLWAEPISFDLPPGCGRIERIVFCAHCGSRHRFRVEVVTPHYPPEEQVA